MDLAVARKARSIAMLDSLGIAHLDSLPLLPEDGEVSLPSMTEVIDRLSALVAVAVRGETAATGEPMSIEEISGAVPRALQGLTPAERAWMSDPAPDEQEITNFTWRYECLPVLLWVIGLNDELTLPAAICEVPGVTAAVVKNDLDEMEQNGSLRPVGAVLDQADLYYRVHWAIVNSRVGTTPPVEGILPGAVIERRHALEWLIDRETPWDDISLDT